jgi:hypothetical protein
MPLSLPRITVEIVGLGTGVVIAFGSAFVASAYDCGRTSVDPEG